MKRFRARISDIFPGEFMCALDWTDEQMKAAKVLIERHVYRAVKHHDGKVKTEEIENEVYEASKRVIEKINAAILYRGWRPKV